ncbi:MAG: hypothetical protein ABJA02_03005, partial [Acidobacteriota bacterium]
MNFDWPFYDPDLLLLILMFFAGIGAGFGAFRMWKAIINEHRTPPDTLFHASSQSKQIYTSFQASLVTIVAVAFVLAGGISVVFSTIGKYQFRSVPIDKLVAIEVSKASQEGMLDRNKMIRIENRNG